MQGQSLTYQSPRDLVPSSSEEEEDTCPGAAAEAKVNAGISAVEPVESVPGLGARGQRTPPPPRRISAVQPVEMLKGLGGAKGRRAVVAEGGVGAEKEKEEEEDEEEEGGDGIIIEAVAAAVEAGAGGGVGQEGCDVVKEGGLGGRDVVEERGRDVVGQAAAAARFAATMAKTMAQKSIYTSIIYTYYVLNTYNQYFVLNTYNQGSPQPWPRLWPRRRDSRVRMKQREDAASRYSSSKVFSVVTLYRKYT